MDAPERRLGAIHASSRAQPAGPGGSHRMPVRGPPQARRPRPRGSGIGRRRVPAADPRPQPRRPKSRAADTRSARLSVPSFAWMRARCVSMVRTER